jgi:peptidoglycan/LPS O-acetylase OafA/YrhL
MNYRADLDGIRAIAVVLVILTHARFPIANDGGTTGVTAFFVLSGYLITRLLVSEREATGRIDLRAFYLRRVLRLGPALLVLIAFVAFIGVWVGWPSDWQMGILATLLYVGNWVQVMGHGIDPLGHTWTLAIEEQFYVVWPIVLILAGARWALRLAVTGAILGGAAAMVAGGDFEYFSTLTRGDAILAGCVLGMVQLRTSLRVGIAGLVLLLAVTYLNLSHDLATPLSILASGMMVTSTVPALGVLAPVGRRAYGLYLWNWPMAILFGPVGALPTFAVAALSYRLVERPLSRRFGPSLRRLSSMRLAPDVQASPAPVISTPLVEQAGP